VVLGLRTTAYGLDFCDGSRGKLMKASEAIRMLSGYDPNEELVIMWWDRDTMGNYGEVYLTNEDMAYADEAMGDDDWLMNSINDTITEHIATRFADLTDEEKMCYTNEVNEKRSSEIEGNN